ncbi:hypothetical protein [Chitinophaga nivalis]|uniref:TRAM domain-containing protein n=1 Tax=Chitinophaga nivalis TaxID=2991709 RepID=A0ABT3IKZ6_9BACT|nr:hypothetical protein [Chitinophaga nivalis]MCW3465675.1 hypothetical protein [Chitinophaga nivalis]MCW3484634.1 hypothetical protein [Chitinophaga nivalis]
MMSAPVSWICTLLLKELREDTATPGKYFVSGEILAADAGAKENTFFAKGRQIQGFTFHLPEGIQQGATIRALVAFMGDPFTQQYQLSDIQPAD